MAEILLYATKGIRQGGREGEGQIHSRLAADAGVVNFYDAANRCKIAKLKNVHTHSHTHTQPKTSEGAHNGRLPGRQSAPELHQSCLSCSKTELN